MIALDNPLYRLDFVRWRTRFFTRLAIGLLIFAALAILFAGRTGMRGRTGYLDWLVTSMLSAAGPLAGAGVGRAGFRLSMLAQYAVNFEAAVLRLTTVLPWILVMRSVWRVRRSGLVEPLLLTPLTQHQWVGGLLGPPLFISMATLTLFCGVVVFPTFWYGDPSISPVIRESYRTAQIYSIPFIWFEGVGNAVLVAAITFHEALSTRRLSSVVGRSLAKILLLQLLHVIFVQFTYGMASTLSFRFSPPLSTFILRAMPLWICGGVKWTLGGLALRWLVATFFRRMQEDSERA